MIGDTMELGEIIRNRRKEKGMSLVLLGKELGLYDSDISKIEHGKDISLNLLSQIAQVLDMDILDILISSGHISDDSIKKHQIIPWENLALLSETDMRYIRHFVDALIVNKKGDT